MFNSTEYQMWSILGNSTCCDLDTIFAQVLPFFSQLSELFRFNYNFLIKAHFSVFFFP